MKKYLKNENCKALAIVIAVLACMFVVGGAATYLVGLSAPVSATLEQGVTAEHNSTSEKAMMQTREQPVIINKADNWGLGFGPEGSKPTGNATSEYLKEYDAYYVDDTTEKVIYLTFDAGFENGYTEAILDALKKHNAQATFFVVGHYLETAPELVKRMTEEGHTVANHTYSHPDMSKISDKAAFEKEMNDVAALYKDITGQEMEKYYRPPQGKYSESNLQMAKDLGYKTFFWSLAYVDWYQDDQPTKEEAFDKLLKRIHPGAIVLLHSTSKTNGEIMDELLTKWEEMGYCIKPLSELVSR